MSVHCPSSHNQLKDPHIVSLHYLHTPRPTSIKVHNLPASKIRSQPHYCVFVENQTPLECCRRLWCTESKTTICTPFVQEGQLFMTISITGQTWNPDIGLSEAHSLSVCLNHYIHNSGQPSHSHTRSRTITTHRPPSSLHIPPLFPVPKLWL